MRSPEAKGQIAMIAEVRSLLRAKREPEKHRFSEARARARGCTPLTTPDELAAHQKIGRFALARKHLFPIFRAPLICCFAAGVTLVLTQSPSLIFGEAVNRRSVKTVKMSAPNGATSGFCGFDFFFKIVKSEQTLTPGCGSQQFLPVSAAGGGANSPLATVETKSPPQAGALVSLTQNSLASAATPPCPTDQLINKTAKPS